MLPFSFQKGNKSAGCEDAPPVANARFSIVCDGLGGSGSTKHKVEEAGVPKMRTSGYLGSRIVTNSVSAFYEENYDRITTAVLKRNAAADTLQSLIEELKQKIKDDVSFQMSIMGIDPMLTRKKALKIFPTTLSSALYIQDGRKYIIFAIWAGDSRIYVLSPTKGLQLLSLDDAANADTEMKSASEMNNCISAGNPFRLNYSLFEIEEPGIVFCCSDGCFDYLPSPLHFEWLLLQTILSCVPEASADNLGISFANSVRDTVYQSIGDDTTMAGVIYKINTTEEFKTVFSSRMKLFGQLALQMNDALKNQKSCQNEKDSAAKKCRLYEEKVISDLRDAVTAALLYKTPTVLYSFIGTLPCYVSYQDIVDDINRKVDEECIAELEELNSQINELKKVCSEMIIRDYIKWRRLNQDSSGGASAVIDFLSPKTRGVSKKNYNYLRPSSYLQPLSACLQLFNQPDFKRIGMRISLPDDDFSEYVQSQVGTIEALIAIMGNESPLFEDLWSQAYFSTPRFEKDRREIKCSREYPVMIEEALNNPMSCRYISELTLQKIDSYKIMSNNLLAIQQKYMKERENRVKAAPIQFFLQNEKELVEIFFKQSAITLSNLFAGTGVSMERLISFVEARQEISEIDQKLEIAQENVVKIWNLYRPDYQLFSKITEKGVV